MQFCPQKHVVTGLTYGACRVGTILQPKENHNLDAKLFHFLRQAGASIQALAPVWFCTQNSKQRASRALTQRLLRRASRRASVAASWCSAVRRRSASRCVAALVRSSCRLAMP